MSRQAVITPEGLEKLKEEIEFLSTTKRREVAARIKEAREFGDISENAEYDDAKNEQALLEGRIAQLEERLRRATVIDEGAISLRRGRLRLDRARQGPENRRLAEIPDRRLDRGQPGGAQALQRVADRQGAPRARSGTTSSRSSCPAARRKNSKSPRSSSPDGPLGSGDGCRAH